MFAPPVPKIDSVSNTRLLQRKLVVGKTNDPLEFEADRVADQVVSKAHRQSAISPAPPQVAGKCAACEDEEHKTLHAKGEGISMGGGKVPSSVYNVLRSPGQPLDTATRAFMEPRFGRDFSDVRVHAGAAAGESARAVNAQAYAVERNVVFAPGKFAPHSDEGRRLLAHELTHVVQQSGGGPGVSAENGGQVIRRYGHANSCNLTDHLVYIWPGHAQAKVCVQKAIDATDGRALTSDVSRNLLTFFGKDSTTSGNLAKINANFRTIATALDAQYLYHCSKKGDTSDPDAITCKGQNAETARSGNKDITLCFDNPGNWSVPWATWLIIHENVHRGLNVWGHSWEAGSLSKCINNNGALSTSQLDLDNPDSYACFAVLICASQSQQQPDGGTGEVQRSAKTGTPKPAVPPAVHNVLRSAGQPLDASARAFFEPRFGRDFGNVRIHTGSLAAESARAVDAHAYAVGSHVVFDNASYAPGTAAGRRLLAHELSHVVQQSHIANAAVQPSRISHPSDALEVAAERQASHVMSPAWSRGTGVPLQPASGLQTGTLHRYKVPDSLKCSEVAGWLDANSPYRPEWAETDCDYSFNGDLKVTSRKSGTGEAVTATGHQKLTVGVNCPTDLPEWSPSGRDGRTKQLLAWMKMIKVLDAHEARHRAIGQTWRTTLEQRFRAVNTTATGTGHDDAIANLSQKLGENQQKWKDEAQKAQTKIDPFRGAILTCPEETGMEEIAPKPDKVAEGVPNPEPVKLGEKDTPAQPKPLSPEVQQLFPEGS